MWVRRKEYERLIERLERVEYEMGIGLGEKRSSLELAIKAGLVSRETTWEEWISMVREESGDTSKENMEEALHAILKTLMVREVLEGIYLKPGRWRAVTYRGTDLGQEWGTLESAYEYIGNCIRNRLMRSGCEGGLFRVELCQYRLVVFYGDEKVAVLQIEDRGQDTQDDSVKGVSEDVGQRRSFAEAIISHYEIKRQIENLTPSDRWVGWVKLWPVSVKGPAVVHCVEDVLEAMRLSIENDATNSPYFAVRDFSTHFKNDEFCLCVNTGLVKTTVFKATRMIVE